MNIIVLCAWACGLGCGYIIWAPETPFKRALLDGLTLRRVWGKK